MKIEDITHSTINLDNSKKIVLNILYTNNLLIDKLNEILKPFDLSCEQYNVLRILRGQKGNPVNMCLIQERMITKNSNTTRLIDKLLKKDFVTRKVCAKNRRKIEVEITQNGQNVLLELDPKVKDFEETLACNLLKEEINQLNTLLEKYRQI